MACACLFEVGPEALRESNMTVIYGYIDQDFLDNAVNNYLVPLSPYFGLQNVKYIQCRFRPQNAHFLSKETISKFGVVYSGTTLMKERITMHIELPLHFIRRKDSSISLRLVVPTPM